MPSVVLALAGPGTHDMPHVLQLRVTWLYHSGSHHCFRKRSLTKSAPFLDKMAICRVAFRVTSPVMTNKQRKPPLYHFETTRPTPVACMRSPPCSELVRPAAHDGSDLRCPFPVSDLESAISWTSLTPQPPHLDTKTWRQVCSLLLGCHRFQALSILWYFQFQFYVTGVSCITLYFYLISPSVKTLGSQKVNIFIYFLICNENKYSQIFNLNIDTNNKHIK